MAYYDTMFAIAGRYKAIPALERFRANPDCSRFEGDGPLAAIPSPKDHSICRGPCLALSELSRTGDVSDFREL
ncbi:unnamed protein product [Clonostachys chloroleuca]|uniref:Uncharacterized protein n=1 Tax=Clonostachys chloroleuca TaxID=1926264 RepID=A0AA35LRK1_9HYPO|nr:unnamed protein product [Clonostachys chloroleuca]